MSSAKELKPSSDTAISKEVDSFIEEIGYALEGIVIRNFDDYEILLMTISILKKKYSFNSSSLLLVDYEILTNLDRLEIFLNIDILHDPSCIVINLKRLIKIKKKRVGENGVGFVFLEINF